MSAEDDEAGKLSAFRHRFGRSWDAEREGEEGGATSNKGNEVSLEMEREGFFFVLFPESSAGWECGLCC